MENQNSYQKPHHHHHQKLGPSQKTNAVTCITAQSPKLTSISYKKRYADLTIFICISFPDIFLTNLNNHN